MSRNTSRKGVHDSSFRVHVVPRVVIAVMTVMNSNDILIVMLGSICCLERPSSSTRIVEFPAVLGTAKDRNKLLICKIPEARGTTGDEAFLQQHC